MKPHYKLVCDYVFSNKIINDYTEHEQMVINLAIDVLTTHGSGGKFMEKLIQLKYKIQDDGLIHGFDGTTKDNRKVEIKTETSGKSKKLCCESSFSPNTEKTPNKKILYLNEKPVLINSGICAETGKCIYVMFTDVGLLNPNSLMFERLEATSPRLTFKHWCGYPEAFSIKYKNIDLVDRWYFEIDETLIRELKNVARLPI